jgi:hypothetical protein
MIPVWFNPLAGLLVALAVFGLVTITVPATAAEARRPHLIRFLCGAAAVAAIVLFAIRLIVTA